MPPLPETLTTRLSSLLRRAPVTCPPDTPIRAALGMMRRDKVGSILLVDADGRPAGVFTLNDLRDRVAAEECDLDRPMRTVMTPNPFCLDGDATALEAALAMAQRLIHHVVVTSAEGRILGVVSEKDLFALQRLGVGHIAATLAEADDLAALFGRDAGTVVLHFQPGAVAVAHAHRDVTAGGRCNGWRCRAGCRAGRAGWVHGRARVAACRCPRNPGRRPGAAPRAPSGRRCPAPPGAGRAHAWARRGGRRARCGPG